MTGRHIFTGTAGVYHVMHKLACEGIHASCTHGNAPNVDILVSSGDVSRMVAIEVKTTQDALRFRGRGTNKLPYELQFPIGHRAAKLNSPNLLLAFVDLRGFSSPPDVYVYPSAVVAAFCSPWVDQVSYARFHVPVAAAEAYKNNWNIVRDALAGLVAVPATK